MKKIFLLLFALLFTSQAKSQIFIEDFDYPANTQISTTTLWYAANNSVVAPITAAIPGLTFPDYIGSGIGNTGYIPSSAQTGETDSASLVPSVNSGAVYSSFMINMNLPSSLERFFFSLQGSNNQNYGSVFIKGTTLLRFQIGLQKTGSDTVVYDSQLLNSSQTYLVIVKYEFKTGSGDDDEVSLFVFDNSNPPPSIEPAPNVGPLTSASPDAPNLSRVYLNHDLNGPDIYIDGIYVDQAWNNSVLPVELTSFTSSLSGRDVTLNWTTSSENNNSVFEIERLSESNSWTKVGSVSGNGTTGSVSNYTFKDNGLSTGTYKYRLKQIDFNGNFEYYYLNNDVNIGIPSGYDLSQNYPNPFNPSTSINFDIPEDGNVSIKLFDLTGKEVGTIINEVKTAGYYTLNYNASSLPSGIYFYTIQTNNYSATKKMMLIK